jgi:hypothetical protein
MKPLLVLVALIGLGASPVLATDNVYTVSKKLTIGQFAANCDSMGGDFDNHGTTNTGTCSKSNGSNITCSRSGGVTTCSGYDPDRPKAPA